MDMMFIYVTARDRAEALSIGRTLVEERLVACVNVLGGVHSLYWWEGKVQEDDEALFVAKTRSELAQRVVARVKELHSYQTPCVVALPIADGNPDFLDWISAETGPQR
jgi:periplasmic divalent cation tolerance protein